jgi:hypothetical protein
MSEPTMNDQLEAMRTALLFVSLCNADNLPGMNRVFEGLNPFEVGTTIGALAQLGVAAVHCMAVINGVDWDEQLQKMEAEIAASIKDGGTSHD